MADTVETTNGARLVGFIIKIESGLIHLETSYAGTLQIKQIEVVGFSTENPVFVRFSSGNTMSGVVEMTAHKRLKITNDDGIMITQSAKISSTWAVGEIDPEVKKLQAWKESMKRRW